MRPEFQQDPRMIRLTDAGHTTTYADIMWINLIQYIADNVNNNLFVTYAPPRLDTISELHPHFTRAYTLALLLTPSLDREGVSFVPENLRVAEKNLAIWMRWMKENCDQEKINRILSGGLTGLPWDDPELKNPCTDGYIAYYAGFIADGLELRERSRDYYMIASTHVDAPAVSRYLAVLAEWKRWDRREAALQFFLTATNGYDEPQFLCQEKSSILLEKISRSDRIDRSLVDLTKEYETQISEPTDKKNPLSTSPTNCYQSFQRWVKQVYLSYISDRLKDFPDITLGDDALERWIIKDIPYPVGYEWYTIKRMTDGRWEYRKLYK
jgi:hypothetical protein